jgi:hypothetical protein
VFTDYTKNSRHIGITGQKLEERNQESLEIGGQRKDLEPPIRLTPYNNACMGQFRQNLFHLRHDIILSRKSHLVQYLWMDDISRTAEVRDHRYGASIESFEN